MKRTKAFPYVFFHSLTSIEYYKDILKTRRSFSVKYFLVLASLATVITTLSYSVRVTPVVRTTINSVLTQLETMYPDDLVLTSKDNSWEINQDQPYILAFPPMEKTESTDMPENFIVFDKEGTIDDIDTYNTFVLINEKNILVKGTDRLESYPIRDIPNGEFSKGSLNQAITNVQSFVWLVELLIVVLLTFSIAIYQFAFRAIYLLFIGAFTWALSQVAGTNYTYKQSLRLSIHTMTLPIVVELMVTTASIQLNLPMWFMMINLIFSAVVVLGLSKSTKQPVKKAKKA